MALATRQDLYDAVKNWLNRGDLTARIPEFVELGDARVRRDQEWDLRTYVAETGNAVTINISGDALPVGVKIVKDLWPTSGSSLAPLHQTTLTELRSMADGNLDAVGVPQAYAIVPARDPGTTAARIHLWPRPSGAYLVDFLYVKDIGKLPSNGNELLAYAPDVYLYAALAAAAPFLKHDERAPMWRAFYDEAMDALNNQTKKAQFGASLTRAKLPVIS